MVRKSGISVVVTCSALWSVGSKLFLQDSASAVLSGPEVVCSCRLAVFTVRTHTRLSALESLIRKLYLYCMIQMSQNFLMQLI